MVAQQAEMEDIISSIRTTLAEETAKVGGNSADLIDAAAAQDDEVLELTAAEMVPAATPAATAAGADDLVDIDAFSSSGEAKPAAAPAVSAAEDLLGEPVAVAPATAAAPAVEAAPAAPAKTGEAADEFDRLLAQISDEQKQHVVTANEQKQALLEEEEPLGGAIPAPVVKASETVPAAPNGVYRTDAAMTAAVSGSQVALPAEVLAMALRPMVQEWLQENLSSVVEKLVKDEISKLNQG